jgi:hypothetical protein
MNAAPAFSLFFVFKNIIVIYIIAARNVPFPANLGETSSHSEHLYLHSGCTRVSETCATYDLAG